VTTPTTEPTPGIAVIPYDHSRLSYLLPRNHHGDQVAPLTADGQPYRFCWTDPGQAMVYAETADDLLAYWIPQYQGADSAGRARLRAEHALQIRPNIMRVRELRILGRRRVLSLLHLKLASSGQRLFCDGQEPLEPVEFSCELVDFLDQFGLDDDGHAKFFIDLPSTTRPPPGETPASAVSPAAPASTGPSSTDTGTYSNNSTPRTAPQPPAIPVGPL